MNKDQARIGRYMYACKNGVASSARYFSKEPHLERPLNESTVHGIERVYLAELTHKQCAEEDLSIESLSPPKREHMVLLGADFDVAIRGYMYTYV